MDSATLQSHLSAIVDPAKLQSHVHALEALVRAHPVAAAATALVSLYTLKSIKNFSKNRYLPPGPRGLPIFGNMFQLSSTPWVEFENWRQEFGELVYITAAGQGMLILNSHISIGDLLDRRGNIYSDRPRWIVAGELFSGGLLMVTSKCTDIWKKMRRAGHEALNKSVSNRYQPIQAKEALVLADALLQDPNSWDDQFRRTSASTVLSMTYDMPTVMSTDHPAVQRVNEFNDRFVISMRLGAHLVEFFPWMLHIPARFAKWKRDALASFEEFSQLFEKMFFEVEKKIKDGDERASFAGSLIRYKARHKMSDRESAWLSATMYAAGAETSASVMSWFLLAMIAYPEKQKKCQEELDAVVGRSRMPTFQDMENLPYTRAMVREALRWRPVTPLGVHHYLTQDDWYKGYYIPKGTVIFANVWSLNRDPEVYGPDADDFNPDRFITKNGQLSPALADTKEEGHLTYGFGPRICLGRHMANNGLFINIASLLWAATITPAKDVSGKDIIPDTLTPGDAGLAVRPPRFECSITPRFPDAATVLAQTKELHGIQA